MFNRGHRTQGDRHRSGNRIWTLTLLLIVSGVVSLPAVQAGHDYISDAPPTVYEEPVMSPQTMDYDAANKTFIAHPGWIRDKLIHYYKFRMYTPDTYPTRVTPGATPDIPIGEVFLVTTTGDFSGVVLDQKPILRWHTTDGEDYSDFVQVVWAEAPAGYVPNTFRSAGDLLENQVTLTASGIYVNLPVVPIESRLQDPSGTGFSPIQPLMAWYRGVEVQTFAFETTSQTFADYFNPITREGSAAQSGSGYEITVSSFVRGDQVGIIPIWHLNQYWSGVVPGENHGGPWRGGQRNIIDLDRSDAGYSPLWQVFWVAAVPVNYRADMASSALQITEANGFKVLQTPMFVNCPNVGPMHGTTPNSNKASSFGKPQIAPEETVRVQGALVMEAGKTIDAFVGETKVASTQTAMMGGYELSVASDVLTEGANTIVVKDAGGTVLQTISLSKTSRSILGVPTTVFVAGVLVAAAVVAAAVVVWSRRRARSREPGRQPPMA